MSVSTPLLAEIKKNAAGQMLSLKNWSVIFSSTISEMPESWSQLAIQENVFLDKPYLKALEENPPYQMKFGYLLFFEKNVPAGLAALQILPFNAEKSLNEPAPNDGSDACFFRAFSNYLKGLVASKVEFTSLVCGNLLLTGENSFYFNPDRISRSKGLDLLEEGLEFAQKEILKKGIKTDVTFIKDFFESTRNSTTNGFKKRGFYEFSVQPNMIFQLKPDWKSFEDYLSAMTSKYRVRARRALKKLSPIFQRELSTEEMVLFKSRIFHLYKNISENAGFNVVALHDNYFQGLKKHLGADFRLVGYFMGEELVAFYTTIQNGEELEAHFVGYDPAFNQEHQLYLNMLYDMIRDGIENGSATLNFARTALEIKSSVGAEPHQMYCYIRHRNNFANKFLKPLMEYLNPEVDWVQRSPFKD